MRRPRCLASGNRVARAGCSGSSAPHDRSSLHPRFRRALGVPRRVLRRRARVGAVLRGGVHRVCDLHGGVPAGRRCCESGARCAWCSPTWRAFLLMNLFTAVAWLSYFQSLRFLEPAIANVLHAGLGPLTIMAMGAIGWRIVDAGRMTASRDRVPGRDGTLSASALVAVALARPVGRRGRHASALTGCAFAVSLGRRDHHRDALCQASARRWRERRGGGGDAFPRRARGSRCCARVRCRTPARAAAVVARQLARARARGVRAAWRCRSISTRSA